METQKPLLKDEDGEEVDVHLYILMIGSLMYLSSSRPDIMFAVLWYPKDSPFDLIAYTDSDYARASLDRKSITGVNAMKSVKLIMENLVIRENRQSVLVRKRIERNEIFNWEDAEGVDCLPNATIFEELTRMCSKTTAWNEFSSTMASTIICLASNQKFNFSKYIFESMVKNLDSVGKFLMYPRFVQVFLEQQVGEMTSHKMIYVTPSHTKKIFGNIRRVGKGFSRRETPLFLTMVVQAQAEMGEDEAVYKERDDSLVRAATIASSLEVEQDSGNINKTQSKATLNEPIPQGTGSVNTPQSNKDSLKLKELMDFCTKLQQRVLDLENTKTAQAQEITSLKLRVKKLEKKGGSRTYKLKRLYKIGRSARMGRYGDDLMFDVNGLAGEEVVAAKQGVPDSKKDDVVSTADDAAQPKVKGIVFKEPVESTTTRISSQQPFQATVQDKGIGKMVEPEPVKKFSKKDQIRLDEELAFKLQAKEEEERLAREKNEANVALTEEWNDIQAKIEADQLLAERLQAREQEELTIEERAKLFQQLLEKRRKHFASMRA
ncbi:hypothetical protein Tco_0478226 [Tanacetum coccineum]